MLKENTKPQSLTDMLRTDSPTYTGRSFHLSKRCNLKPWLGDKRWELLVGGGGLAMREQMDIDTQPRVIGLEQETAKRVDAGHMDLEEEAEFQGLFCHTRRHQYRFISLSALACRNVL